MSLAVDPPTPFSGDTMFTVETDDNEKLDAVLAYLQEHDYIDQYWECMNVMVAERMGYTNHGEDHVHTVADNGLRLLRLLVETETPSIVEDYDMTVEDAEVVVFLAAILHDIGQVIHRYKHSEYGLPLAADLMDDLLDVAYDPREAIIVKSEVLHAIQSHHKKANPLTLEAGILRVADALDIEKKRAAGAVENGSTSIHSISALSVESVELVRGDDVPVLINVEMNNSSGIFQLDELVKEKLEGSGIEDKVRIRAEITGDQKKIVETYEL